MKSQLRRRLVAHVTGAGADPATLDPGELATLTTRGLDALDDYVARYLPQLVLAVLVPIAVLVVVLDADWLSALIIALTLPLIPVFMALVGWQAQDHTRKQWRLLNRLGGHFLDAVEGLPTLAIFRRARAEAALVRRTSEAHREATMRTLRIAFLSALVLELLATLSVALVAVQIGIRLLYGQLDLETALLVLILAPEAYLPLREVGARFHASMEGVAAAEQVFTVLERPGRVPADRTGGAAVPDGPVELRLRGRAPHPSRAHRPGAGRRRPGGPRRADAAADRDERGGQDDPALGAAAVRRRRRRADHGERDGRCADLPVAGVAPPDRVAAAAAVPVRRQRGRQRPARGARRRRRGRRAGRRARRGHGRRRRAAATGTPPGSASAAPGCRRASASGSPSRGPSCAGFDGASLVLLDEPTAHLDPDNAAAVRAGVARLLDGATGIVVAHDTGWADLADEVVRLEAGRVVVPSGVDPVSGADRRRARPGRRGAGAATRCCGCSPSGGPAPGGSPSACSPARPPPRRGSGCSRCRRG